MHKTISDMRICPKCGSDNAYDWGTDEIDFGDDNKGHYVAYAHCSDCNNDFRYGFEFYYDATNIY